MLHHTTLTIQTINCCFCYILFNVVGTSQNLGGFFLCIAYLSEAFRILDQLISFTFAQSKFAGFLSKSKSSKYSRIFLDIIFINSTRKNVIRYFKIFLESVLRNFTSNNFTSNNYIHIYIRGSISVYFIIIGVGIYALWDYISDRRRHLKIS